MARDLRLRGSFLSCNRAFVRSREPDAPQVWCLECPKCLFTFLCFAPWLTVAEAESIFGGNPLADAELTESFRDLWRPESKPFDCVGERMESAVAMSGLARRPGWGETAVVRALAAEADAVAGALGADEAGVLAVTGPHLIPDGLLSLVADRCRRRPVRRADLAGRKVALLGLGIDMAATLAAIAESEPGELFAVDVDRERALRVLADAGLGDVAVFETVGWMPPADVAVRSPGFPLYSADLQDRVSRGMETVTPLGLWLAERGTGPTVALTGTKGKSTVSVLTTLALEHLGRPAVTVGNIGIGPWTLAPSADETVVIEVSSYQAADLGCTPSIAALTSIGEDHTDWHGSVDRYHRDKARVFTAPAIGGRRWAGVLDDVVLPPAFDDIEFCRIAAPAGGIRARNAHLAAATALAVDRRGGRPGAGGGRGRRPARTPIPSYPGASAWWRRSTRSRYVDDALASNPLGLAASIGEVGPGAADGDRRGGRPGGEPGTGRGRPGPAHGPDDRRSASTTPSPTSRCTPPPEPPPTRRPTWSTPSAKRPDHPRRRPRPLLPGHAHPPGGGQLVAPLRPLPGRGRPPPPTSRTGDT